MKYAVNQIALLKSGMIGTICKTELIDGKGYYTISLGNDVTKVVRTGDVKSIIGNVLSEIPGRDKKELVKYFDGKKANVKELKKFYKLLAEAKIVDDIIDVDVNVNAKSGLSYDEFAEWFGKGRIKEKSNISLNPYIGYIVVEIDEKTQVKMLVANIDDNSIYPLFYQVNDMDMISGQFSIDISQKWTLKAMNENNARMFRTQISTYSNMLYLSENKCFIPKDILPKKGDVIKMKDYNPDTLPAYLNAVNLFFSGKEVKIKTVTPRGDVVFNPTDKKLRSEDYYCLVNDLCIDDLTSKAIKEPPTKQI